MLKNIKAYLRRNLISLSVTIICIYALFLRLMRLHQHALWGDEYFQLRMLQGTFLDILKNLPAGDICSYLEGDYYLMYPFFKIFAYNKWGLAIPHIIATVAGFYLLYLICKRYLKTPWAYFITFGIVCFNATLILHATEIRAYAVLPTLALGTFYLFQRMADLHFKLSPAKKIGASMFFVAVIWFHVYGVVMFFSCLLFTILDRYKEKDFKAYFKKMILFSGAVLCVAMPLWLYSVLGPHLDVAENKYDLFSYIPNPFYNIVGFLKGIFGSLIGYKKLYFLLLGVIWPFILHYKERSKQLLFLVCLIVIPLGIILLFDFFGKYLYMQRQFIWVMPFFALFLGWAWDSFFLKLINRSLQR